MANFDYKRYISELVVVPAAVIILIVFFLPWIRVTVPEFSAETFQYVDAYTTASGYKLAHSTGQPDALVYVLPLVAVIALATTWGYHKYWLDRTGAAFIYMSAGSLGILVLFLKALSLTHLIPSFGDEATGSTYLFSWWITWLAMVAMIIAGYVSRRIERHEIRVAAGDRVATTERIQSEGVLFPKVGRQQPILRFSWYAMTLFLIIGVILHLLPFYYMIALSFTPGEETISPTPVLIPENPTTAAWELVFKETTDSARVGMDQTNLLDRPFAVYFRNSLFMTLMTLAISLPVTSMAAYANSKLMRGRLKRYSFFFFIGTLMVPAIVTLIPSFLLARHFPYPTTIVPTFPGTDKEMPYVTLWNTPWAVIIPGVFSAFNFLLFKGFFDTIPDSVIQAARVDGGSEFNIFRRIVLPLAVPVFAVATWMQFGGVWEQYLWPLVVLNDSDKQPASVAVAELVQEFTQSAATDAESAALMEQDPNIRRMFEEGLSWNGLMVLGLLQAFPVFLMFVICREYLMKGIRIRGFK